MFPCDLCWRPQKGCCLSGAVYMYICAALSATISTASFVFKVTSFVSHEGFEGFWLNTSGSVTVSARSVLECTAACGMWPPCRSMQFCVHTNTCVVNSEDVCQAGFSSLHWEPGCMYYDFLDHPEPQVSATLCTPNPCGHGGHCVEVCGHSHTTCSCPPPYWGELCQNAPGDWGPWGRWSGCDCPRRLRYRQRACDSPAPLGDGQNCNGHFRQAGWCGEEACDD